MSYPTNTLATRLKHLRTQLGLNQTQFGEPIHQTQSTIARWESGAGTPSLQDIENMRLIFGTGFVRNLLELNDEYHHDGVHWVESLPYPLSESQERRIKLGVDFFHKIFVDNLDLHVCLGMPRFIDYARMPSVLYDAFQYAVQMGAIRFTHVACNHQLEADLTDCLRRQGISLGQVIVADVPGDADVSVIRAEFVAFLAASEIFTRLNDTLPHAGRVAFGSGYTLWRIAQHTASIGLFHKMDWMALIGYEIENTIPYAANAIVNRLASLHPRSTATLMPPPSHPHSQEIIHQFRVNLEYLLSAIVLTVNGTSADYRSPHVIATSQSFVDGYSRGWPNSPATVFETLKSQRSHDTIAGEMLGMLFDEDGQISRAVTPQLRTFSLSLDPTVLRDFRERVWLVASMKFKARAVLMALRKGYVGNLIVDSVIADWLVKNLDI